MRIWIYLIILIGISLMSDNPLPLIVLSFGIIIAAVSIRICVELMVYARNERSYPKVRFNPAEHYRIKEDK